MPLNYNTNFAVNGSWVLCIDDHFTADQHLMLPVCPVCGEYYRVREYIENTDTTGKSRPVVLLEEIVNPRVRVVFERYIQLVEPGFGWERFSVVSGSGDINQAIEEFYDILNCDPYG